MRQEIKTKADRSEMYCVVRSLRCVIPVVCVTNEREGNVVKQHN